MHTLLVDIKHTFYIYLTLAYITGQRVIQFSKWQFVSDAATCLAMFHYNYYMQHIATNISLFITE